ncbi:MAG: ATP-binding cassette domain-containing protein, partial [Promicromonosporaceae bacterium]|nr:ATP-binding cassette domain-containing protein [Promicromonosporaceae bacterium]
ERIGVDHIGWVFQNPHGVARRTALDHVAQPFLHRGETPKVARKKAEPILAEFGLGELPNRLFRELSGGEAQRLMLARAVATASDVLLVDEPTAQLDRASADTVNQVFARLARDSTAVIVATHDPQTRDVCQRVIDLGEAQT